jgi:hypothetical protein
MSDLAKADEREPDYRAAMLYHSDRADAFMVERDELRRLVDEAIDLARLSLEAGALHRTQVAAAAFLEKVRR